MQPEELLEKLPNRIKVPARSMRRLMKDTKFANDEFPKKTDAIFFLSRWNNSGKWRYSACYSDGVYLGHLTSVAGDTVTETLLKLIQRLDELNISKKWYDWYQYAGDGTVLADRAA